MIRFAPLLAVVGLLAVALAANVGAAPVRLTATVGPGLHDQSQEGHEGRPHAEARHLSHHRQRPLGQHNFRLRGPSGRLLSSVGWTGTKTVRLRLRPGRYTYVCDPHADQMRGGFRVT